MSDAVGQSNGTDITNTKLYEILRSCANIQSYDSLSDHNEVIASEYWDSFSMISTNSYSTSGNISTSSFTSDDSFGDNILEENGRISLAYENLRTIPRRIAERFAAQTKFLDLSYNQFHNLAFLTFFDELHTLILDRNYHLDVNTLPYLPNLKILWINNCNITNIADWVKRIQVQCPTLEHLSLMGNPGNYNRFNSTPTGNNASANTDMDYRIYILQALPNLQFLDGISRSNSTKQQQNGYHHYTNGNSNSSHMPSCSSNNKMPSGNYCQKNSPARSFKDLFRLNKRRKKSYQSSSTN